MRKCAVTTVMVSGLNKFPELPLTDFQDHTVSMARRAKAQGAARLGKLEREFSLFEYQLIAL